MLNPSALLTCWNCNEGGVMRVRPAQGEPQRFCSEECEAQYDATINEVAVTDDLELDDNPGPLSRGEGGAWVQVWLWVPQDAEENDDNEDDEQREVKG